MELNDKVTQLEDEIKILKNEVQAVLLDLRESCLNYENPFNTGASPLTQQPITINQQLPLNNEQPSTAEEEPGEITDIEDQASELEEEDQESELVKLEEQTGEAGLVCEPELGADSETIQEEVKGMWHPDIETKAHYKSKDTTDSADGKIDLTTVARLAGWVDEAVKRLGHERTKVILDISEMMGHVNPDLKDILVKFISPILDEHSGRVGKRDYLASLIELGSLLGKDNKSDIALLYILCQENDNG